jgi:hypothetical protein
LVASQFIRTKIWHPKVQGVRFTLVAPAGAKPLDKHPKISKGRSESPLVVHSGAKPLIEVPEGSKERSESPLAAPAGARSLIVAPEGSKERSESPLVVPAGAKSLLAASEDFQRAIGKHFGRTRRCEISFSSTRRFPKGERKALWSYPQVRNLF